jgi:hypothetical protein
MVTVLVPSDQPSEVGVKVEESDTPISASSFEVNSPSISPKIEVSDATEPKTHAVRLSSGSVFVWKMLILCRIWKE